MSAKKKPSTSRGKLNAERAAAAEALRARRERATTVLKTVSDVVGTIMSSSPEAGFCLLDLYGQVTGDPVVSAFARGALQHRVAARAAEVARDARPTSAEPAVRAAATKAASTYDWRDWVKSGGLQ